MNPNFSMFLSFFIIFLHFLFFSNFSFFSFFHFAFFFFQKKFIFSCSSFFFFLFFIFLRFSFLFLFLFWDMLEIRFFLASIASSFLVTFLFFEPSRERGRRGTSLGPLFFFSVVFLGVKSSFSKTLFNFLLFSKEKTFFFSFSCISNMFYCWHWKKSLTVSSVVGAPWRCGVLTT